LLPVALLREQGRVVLAIDGLQPTVGHEVLWVLRDCLSGEVLLSRSLLSATIKDIAAMLREVRDALPVDITGVISDGQDTIRKAVAQTLPGVPHQLCHFHYLREAAKPIAEADRHAKKELKKRVRGVRRIEREAEAAKEVRRQLSAVLGKIRQAAVRARAEDVREQLAWFAKVTRSYWPGLFPCYASAEIPRTNNDLEHLFGSYRYQERRASGRKQASAGMVVMGSVRVVSDRATRQHPEEGLSLPSGYVTRWQQVRAELEKRREARRQQRRFRRDPNGYLTKLEELLLQLSLPP
jgi:hypothetical protein